MCTTRREFDYSNNKHYHTGLYHRAILESATAYSIGAMTNTDNARAMTTAFAAVTGCLNRQNDASQYLECFQALPADEFLKAFSKLSVSQFVSHDRCLQN